MFATPLRTVRSKDGCSRDFIGTARSLIEAITTSQLGGRFPAFAVIFIVFVSATMFAHTRTPEFYNPKIAALARHTDRYFCRHAFLQLAILRGAGISVRDRPGVVRQVEIIAIDKSVLAGLMVLVE